MNWQDFKFPVQYIETDNKAFARKAFAAHNGKGKKRQSAFSRLRNEVHVVRIDNDTTDEQDVAIERKVSIAEKHECYPVEEKSSLLRHPGTFANISTFRTLSENELEIACNWHNTYFHYSTLHVSCFFMFRDMIRTFESFKKDLTPKLLEDLAALIQNTFGDLPQYQQNVAEAYRKFHKHRYGIDGNWHDDAYAVALLQLYKQLGGKETIPLTLIDRFEDLYSFFDPAILNNTDFNFVYQEVRRLPNPMKTLNELVGGKQSVVTLQDRVDQLLKSHKWKKAVQTLEDTDWKFDHSRMPTVAMIRLGALLIDEDIQRVLDAIHCAGIINPKTFDPALLTVLQCIKTSNGEFVSIDGQHTSSVLAGLIVAGLLG
jgi:hypothetical protein